MGHVAGWAVDILGRCGAEARLRDVSEGELLIGDGVTQGIVRIGDTVRRPLRPFSLTVQAYLAHPRDAGFTGAPLPSSRTGSRCSRTLTA